VIKYSAGEEILLKLDSNAKFAQEIHRLPLLTMMHASLPSDVEMDLLEMPAQITAKPVSIPVFLLCQTIQSALNRNFSAEMEQLEAIMANAIFVQKILHIQIPLMNTAWIKSSAQTAIMVIL